MRATHITNSGQIKEFMFMAGGSDGIDGIAHHAVMPPSLPVPLKTQTSPVTDNFARTFDFSLAHFHTGLR